MIYKVRIKGTFPLITHNGWSGMDPRNPLNKELELLTRKRGTTRTESDNERIRQIETLNSMYFDDDGRPTFPARAIRKCLETAARKLRQGPAVREGLVVSSIDKFEYDAKRYGTTRKEFMTTLQHTVPVMQQRARIPRTRACFKLPWAIQFTLDCYDPLVAEADLANWLDIGGRQLGLGDWRPEKSGEHGRFVTDFLRPEAAK